MSDPKGALVTPVGFRADGSIHALELDNSDQLKVSAVLTTNPVIVDGASPSLLRPLPKSGLYTNLNVPAGTTLHTAFTVPAGEYWRVTSVGLQYIGTVVGLSLIGVIDNTVNVIAYMQVNPVISNNIYLTNLNFSMSPGWKLQCYTIGATLNDDLYVHYFAERIY